MKSSCIVHEMKVGVLFSGGKDSTLALHKASEHHEIACLISLRSRNDESYMFHVPNIHVTEFQARAMELPLIQQVTSGIKEQELKDLRLAIMRAQKDHDIEGIVTGAVRSVYQAQRIQKTCHELDLWCFNPLWLLDQLELLREVIASKFTVVISGVFSYPLDHTFLGRIIDEHVVQKLARFQEKCGINPAGEGGELETTVLDAPMFKKKLVILDEEVHYDHARHAGIHVIKTVELVEK